MLRMRLQRRGKRNYATYRVVVAERTAPVKGRFIDDVGYYNPHSDAFEVSKEKVAEWIEKGVQATPTVHNLLIEHKIIKGEKVTIWRSKKQEGGESAETAPTPAPETPAEESENSEDAAE